MFNYFFYSRLKFANFLKAKEDLPRFAFIFSFYQPHPQVLLGLLFISGEKHNKLGTRWIWRRDCHERDKRPRKRGSKLIYTWKSVIKIFKFLCSRHGFHNMRTKIQKNRLFCTVSNYYARTTGQRSWRHEQIFPKSHT